jgi:hypothetical protein
VCFDSLDNRVSKSAAAQKSLQQTTRTATIIGSPAVFVLPDFQWFDPCSGSVDQFGLNQSKFHQSLVRVAARSSTALLSLLYLGRGLFCIRFEYEHTTVVQRLVRLSSNSLESAASIGRTIRRRWLYYIQDPTTALGPPVHPPLYFGRGLFFILRIRTPVARRLVCLSSNSLESVALTLLSIRRSWLYYT